MRRWLLLVVLAVFAVAFVVGSDRAAIADQPALRVVLIPADGGTEDGTKADYQPVFNAIARMTGLSPVFPGNRHCRLRGLRPAGGEDPGVPGNAQNTPQPFCQFETPPTGSPPGSVRTRKAGRF